MCRRRPDVARTRHTGAAGHGEAAPKMASFSRLNGPVGLDLCESVVSRKKKKGAT